MAKKVGYEVIAQRPICVDFRDGRVVSFRPGQRFEVERTNTSALRLVRNRDLRELGQTETIPPLPVKLGAPRRLTEVLVAREKIEVAKNAARARLAASRQAAPQIEEAKPMPAPVTKKKPKNKTSLDTPSFDFDN